MSEESFVSIVRTLLWAAAAVAGVWIACRTVETVQRRQSREEESRRRRARESRGVH